MSGSALRWALALAAQLPRDAVLAPALVAMATGPAAPAPEGGGTAAPPDADPERDRLRALVDLATGGDAEAFGQLYDHYSPGVYRFVLYRVGSRALAEDLTSETFMRALRSIQKFTWQGKDFGAWLTTIARNLVTDHFKSGRSRLEIVSDDVPDRRSVLAQPETDVLAHLTNEALYAAVARLSDEQRDCILMRFIQGLSIAETAAALDRSEGAIKQLQLRAVRALAKLIDPEVR
ncbi:sigma-70 family RNA polymerase sigma factor [Aeromicrobium massiliense]|uniref:sigma-70 family RNA polymerase sigma factor n=1 Tax=Aeromicrobium massiliense TaxID=1464554 RepID=UPI000308D1FD|nr:sigma-70 family RNA polymerase sigma factor [Aeromicrobium massiliense]